MRAWGVAQYATWVDKEGMLGDTLDANDGGASNRPNKEEGMQEE